MLSDTLIPYFLASFWISLIAGIAWLARIRYHIHDRHDARCAFLLLTWSALGLLAWGISNHYTGAGISEVSFFQVRHGMGGLRATMWVPLVLAIGAVGVGLGIFFLLCRRWMRTNQGKPQVRNRITHAAGWLLGVLMALNPG